MKKNNVCYGSKDIYAMDNPDVRHLVKPFQPKGISNIKETDVILLINEIV